MDTFRIEGGIPLHGSVTISGAKNAALPLLAATILTAKSCRLCGIPHLHDITTMRYLLEHLGVQIAEIRAGEWRIQAEAIATPEAPYEIVKTMRASSMILGPLLARTGRARVALPGGCAIGARPMDLHLKAFAAMGANLRIEEGYIHAAADRLRGAEITFDIVTVTGTENVMMAAALADGRTVLRNAAREPEVAALADMLVRMGARIAGAGTDVITIDGVAELHGAEANVIPDRIEAGTFWLAAALSGGEVTVRNCPIEYLDILRQKLLAAGATVTRSDSSATVAAPPRLQGVDITTAPFPGFATDLQAQWMAAMTTANGVSTITETIFENRFMHVAELRRMGADITVEEHTAVVRPVARLSGAPVMATDLRASASLVLAALRAHGITEIQRVYHIDRGYERIEEKLSRLGARIVRIK